jgi:hypothetical protein
MSRSSYSTVAIGVILVIVAFAGALVLQAWRTEPLDLGAQPSAEVIGRYVGLTKSMFRCPGYTGKRIMIHPNYGGDRMLMSGGSEQFFDIGDVKDGGLPTLESHDRLVLIDFRPEEVSFERVRSGLLVCAPDGRLDLAFWRFFCRNTAEGKAWNNTMEEITFSTGVTYLSEPLYEAYRADLDALDLTKLLRGDYHLESLSDSEIAGWHVAPMSDLLTWDVSADRACYWENRVMRLFE